MCFLEYSYVILEVTSTVEKVEINIYSNAIDNKKIIEKLASINI